ncbi:MAG: RnfABCDGE type electron transport complex subunit B [Proteobacteria bacterium]|nr:RnfABCDGE type electron transport complex subunit B [Pseudomonadota bacterium]
MTAILLILFLALICGLLVSRVSKMTAQQVDIGPILAVLPQTQCGECDYPGCRPYAEAIVRREADINQCPPGGTETIKALAELLGRQVKPLNQAHGLEKKSHMAFIDEALCIGCVKCIKACPVDAILGATKQMHSVLTGECTGCELCIAPCPMNCISMQPAMD